MLQVVTRLPPIPSCAEAHHLRPLYSNVEQRIDQAGRPCVRGRVSRVFDHQSALWPSTFSSSPRLSTAECSGRIPNLDRDLDGIGAQQSNDLLPSS
jgi:hypothetical protein